MSNEDMLMGEESGGRGEMIFLACRNTAIRGHLARRRAQWAT